MKCPLAPQPKKYFKKSREWPFILKLVPHYFTTLKQMNLVSLNKRKMIQRISFLTLLWFCLFFFPSYAQSLYTAKGYWEETNKPAYQAIKQKSQKGDSLNAEETSYLSDFEKYLDTYFQRLSEEEKKKYAENKDLWSQNSSSTSNPNKENENNIFQWRNRDRINSAGYGIYYSLAFLTPFTNNATTITGLSLVTGGIMLFGPAINPKRFEGISQASVEALKNGRFLGACYGAAIGITLGANSNNPANIILPSSAIGSIAMGEIGFSLQKKRKWSRGDVGMISHYGSLSPLLFLSLVPALNINQDQTVGFGLFSTGIGGLFIGNGVAKRNHFTGGDADAISSLSIISAGIGATTVAAALEKNTNPSPFLAAVPATAGLLGTFLGQSQVKNLNLKDKQGSTLVLASTGAALLGLGIGILSETESPTAIFGLPSGFALITHQVLLKSFARKNRSLNSGANLGKGGSKFQFSFHPESLYLNKRANSVWACYPLASFRLKL
jgi:hypothetical protein